MQREPQLSIRIVLVDYQINRNGLRVLLEKESGLEIVGETGNPDDILSLVKHVFPDVVLLGLDIPAKKKLMVIHQIVTARPKARVIVLATLLDQHHIGETFHVGAMGYVLRDCAFDEVIRAVRAAARGEIYLCPPIAGFVMKDYVKRVLQSGAQPAPTLTSREREVLQLLADGRSTKEIASSLQVSVKTVETHYRHVKEKLGIHNIAGLTKYAVREGLSSLDQ